MWAAKCCIHGRLPCATWNNESDGGLSGIDARRRAMTAAAPTCAAAVLMRSKYLWVIWLGIKSGQSSLKGSVRMINLILLLLSGLVMAIRAEKGVRPLIFGSSSFTACRIPSSFIHGCWIDCLFSPMNDKAALGPTGWEREVAGGQTRLTSIYMQGGFPPPASPAWKSAFCIIYWTIISISIW